MALAVSQAENGTRQCDRKGAVSEDYGIFQINAVHLYRGYTLNDLKDCTKNILIAKEIFDEQGWSPWVAHNNGSYKRFLK